MRRRQYIQVTILGIVLLLGGANVSHSVQFSDAKETIEYDLSKNLHSTRKQYVEALAKSVDVSLAESSIQFTRVLIDAAKYDSAKAVMSETRLAFKGKDTVYLFASYCYQSARIALKSSLYGKAQEKCFRARSLLKATHGLGSALNMQIDILLANSFKYQGLFDSCEFYFKKVEERAKQDKDYKTLAQVYDDYATYSLDRGELEQGRAYGLKSLNLASGKYVLIEQRVNSNLAWLEIASILNEKRQPDQQEFLDLRATLENCLSWFTTNHRLRDAAKIHNAMAILYRLNTMPNGAIKSYRQALDIFKSTADSANMAAVFNNLGDLYENVPIIDSALMYYLKAFELADNCGAWPIAQTAAEGASYTYEALGKPMDALEYQRQSQWIYREKIHTAEREKAVQKYRILYEAEEKERIAQEALLKQKKAENDRKLITAIAISLAIVLLASIALLRSYYIGLRDKKRIHALEMEDLVRKKDEQREGARLEGQDTERKKIARDLHDELGGTLSMIQMHLSGISEKVEGFKEQEKTQYEQANHLLERALEQVRNISRDMMSGTLSKFGLMAAFHDLADIVNTSKQLNFQLVGKSPKRPLKNTSELGIFRVVQELTSNSLKHSNATEIRLELIEHTNELGITYEDNGIGFTTTQAESSSGIGLRNIQSRLAQMNATMSLETSPGKGVLYIIEIPFDTNDKSSPS